MSSFLKINTRTKLIFRLIIYSLIMVNLLHRLHECFKEKELIMKCYSITEPDILPSIEDLKPQEHSIFFHETSCRGGLNARQACAVESAATGHPNRQVYVLFNSPVTNKTMLHNIDEFNNVNVARIYLNYSTDTLLEDVVNEVYYSSSYPIAHAADVLRFLTLYKWSGIYLDLDTIVVRTLDQLGKNWAAREDRYGIAIGALAFSNDDVGRTAIRTVVDEIIQSYDAAQWSHNGNGAMTRALQRYCNVSRIEDVDTPHCKGFQLYEPDVLYPVYWLDASMYFEQGELTPDETQNAYIHHMWNKMTHALQIQKGSPYSELAKRYCPNTYKLFPNYFGY